MYTKDNIDGLRFWYSIPSKIYTITLLDGEKARVSWNKSDNFSDNGSTEYAITELCRSLNDKIYNAIEPKNEIIENFQIY